MKKIAIPSVVAVLAALAAGAAVMKADAGNARHFVLTATYVKASFKTDDVKPTGRSIGDQFSFTAALKRGATPYGRLEDVDVSVDATIQGLTRTVTLLLQNGTIVAMGGAGSKAASGLPKPAADTVLAVVGGTGAYRSARGEVTEDAGDDAGLTQHLTVDLDR